MTATPHNGGGAPDSAGPLLRSVGRGRAWMYLAVYLASFTAVNAFWRYLGTGQWVDFRPAAYSQDLTVPLAELFRHPLDVLSHPWMILVAGLLLGLAVFLPIVIAVLYRSQYSALLVVIVAAIGHAPVLALAVGIGCALASRSSLRREMPFLAFVLGMLPAGAYLALSALAGVDAAAVPPLQQWALYAPFLIAFVAAVVAGALALGIARLTGFRSGVVCPVLVGILAAPVAMFYSTVGADELAYGLIVNRSEQKRLCTGGSLFPDTLLEPWIRAHRAEGLNPQTTRVRVLEELRLRVDRLVARCETFLAAYPESPRCPEVMWLAAQAQSLRVDREALEDDHIRYTADFILPESAPAWETFLREHAASPQAALADWRLGELTLRAVGKPGAADTNELTARALEHLERADEALLRMFPASADRSDRPELARMFAPAAETPGRAYYLSAKEAVERLLWLMRRNDVLTDPNSAEALGALLDTDPKLPGYTQRIGRLLSDPDRPRERTAMGDNLKLAVALHTSDVYPRAEMLIELAKDERTDAAIVANFELGKLALRTAGDPAVLLIEGLKTPMEYFQQVIDSPPNPYRQKAAEMLASLVARDSTPK